MKPHRAMLIVAVMGFFLFGVPFFASPNLISHPIVPIVPLVNGQTAWSTQTVTTGGSFGTICMVLDSNNNPRIVHAGKDGMMYYTFWDGSNWKTQGVIQGGTPNALVLDSGNNPHILFKGSNGIMYYASLKGSIWSYLVVPEGNRYSLVLDSHGNPHLAYGTQLLVNQYPPGVTNNYYALNYASWNGTGWTVKTVKQQISSSDTISLALDSLDNPHIMYGDDTYYPQSGGYTITVKIATWTGSDWDIQTPLSNLDSIGRMILDSRSYPHFVYGINYPHESGGNVTLGYASWNGATWSTQTIASDLRMIGLQIQFDLALDSHDNPHVEFFNGPLTYATLTGSKWNLDTVAPDNFAYGEGPLTLDSKGNPSICYWVDDIRNTTAFVSQLLYTTPTPVLIQSPTPTPTASTSPSQFASVSKLWSFTSNWSSVNSPVAANGFVYVSSGNSGTGTLSLYCLDSSTGAKIWSHDGLFVTFAVANGFVYVGEDIYGPSNSLRGVISCLNASNGAQVWNYSAGTSFTTPIVGKGIVYAGGFSYSLSTGLNVGFVYAFNASTGEKLWNFLGPADTRFNDNPLVLDDSSLYALSAGYSSQDASWHSGVYAFNALTGQELWNYTISGQFGSILSAGQSVFVCSNFVDMRNYIDAEKSGGYIYAGGILALNASNGKLNWNFPVNSSVGTPVIVNDTIYAVFDDGVLYALNAANGKVIWNYTAGTGLGTLLSTNDYIFVGSSSGAYCFDATNGKIIWNFATTEFTGSSATNPTFADGILYLGGNGPMYFSSAIQHNFYAVNAWNGQKLWNYTMGYTLSSSPTVVNGVVYVGGNFVSTRSPDSESSGVVVSLKSNVVSLPFTSPSPTPTISPSLSITETPTVTPSPSVPEFPLGIILSGIIASTILLAVGFRRRNRLNA